MNEFQCFKNDELGDIHAILADGTIWFLGQEISRSMAYRDPSSAVKDNVNEEDIMAVSILNLPNLPKGVGRNRNIINEHGIRDFIHKAQGRPKRRGKAKRLQKFLDSEVIPALKSTQNQQTLPFQDSLTKQTRIVTNLQCEIDAKNAIISEQKKVIHKLKEKISLIHVLTQA